MCRISIGRIAIGCHRGRAMRQERRRPSQEKFDDDKDRPLPKTLFGIVWEGFKDELEDLCGGGMY